MADWLNKTHVGDCRELMRAMAADGVKVQTCITSPPYFGLRDYGHAGQIGLEPSPAEYVAAMVDVFRCVRDVLADDGTLWLNLGDSYGTGASGQNFDPASGATNAGGKGAAGSFGHKRQSAVKGFHKNLLGIPWRVAFALQADGWYLRQDIIWHKPNPMPESVRDRCTKSHEYLFLLAKSERYYFDSQALQEPADRPEGSGNTYPYQVENELDGANANLGGPLHKIGPRPTRNKRSVWTVTTTPFSGAHFATFPRALIEPCILAGSRPGDAVIDPFMGSGTTAQVATDLGRQFIGCELNPEYVKLHDMRRTTTGMALV